jgi:hypothetical protein
MKKCLQMLTLTAGVLLCGFTATEAKAGLVTADRGSFTWTLTSTGGASGSVMITFTGATLTGVVDGGVPTAVSIPATMTPLTVAYSETTGPPPTGSYTFSFTSTGTKDFGTPPADVLMTYSTSTATASIGSLSINGTMPTTNPITNALPGFDFSPFSNGGIINLSLSDVGVDIGLAIVTGGTLTGTGAFTELASRGGVPEPGSLALLGIGMTGFLAFRRFFKKTPVA